MISAYNSDIDYVKSNVNNQQIDNFKVKKPKPKKSMKKVTKTTKKTAAKVKKGTEKAASAVEDTAKDAVDETTKGVNTAVKKTKGAANKIKNKAMGMINMLKDNIKYIILVVGIVLFVIFLSMMSPYIGMIKSVIF